MPVMTPVFSPTVAGKSTGTYEPSASPTLTSSEFEQIRRLAYQNFGLDLKDGKQSLVVSRLSKELRRLGFTTFEQYSRHVGSDPSGQAMLEMADLLTTNFTSFLREPAHFDFLRNDFAQQLPPNAPVEIWSAASSTGEEAYSILFTLLECLGPNANVRILATDINTRVLRATADAVYDARAVEALPQSWPRKYFLKGNGQMQGKYRVKSVYREHVRCQRFNLVTDTMPSTRFQAIFCRNVTIYFDKPTQEALAKRLASTLIPGGYLFIGHSEGLGGVDHGLEYVKPALYRNGKGGLWRNNAGR